ncbi:MAG: hypothetical protein J6P60_03255 [Lachnospiraceae bacterium]|nr:hypothetical protein [Lachnospiraceae bacterium]
MFDFNFDWRPEMETHIADMDSQHRQLFKIGRDMEQLLRVKCIGVTDSGLLDIILQLRDFTGYHFYEEEKMMEEIGYPGLEQHRKMHLQYAKYVMDINLPKLKNNPEKELRLIRDEIQGWIFSHMLHDDQEFANVYREYLQNRETNANAQLQETEVPIYVEGFGYQVCSLDVSTIYLAADQRQKGELVVAYKEKAKDFAKLTALERNIYFAELSKVSNALRKFYNADGMDYVSCGMTGRNFCFHVIPRYSQNDGVGADYYTPDGCVKLEDAALKERIDEIKKILNK